MGLIEWFRRVLGPSIYDGQLLHSGWYFDLRLVEEIARSEHHGLKFTVLVVLLQSKSVKQGINPRVFLQLQRLLRPFMIATAISDDGLALLLPHTSPEEAARFAQTLTPILATSRPVVGAASYPSDSDKPNGLLLAAQYRAYAFADGGFPDSDQFRRSA